MHEEQKKAGKTEAGDFEKYTPIGRRKRKAETTATPDKPTKVLKAKKEMDRKRKIKNDNKTRDLENRLRKFNKQMHCYNEI